MKDYINSINKRIIDLSNEIKIEADERIKNAKTKEEEEKIKYITLYYRTILQGSKIFSSDMLNNFSKNSDSHIEFDENPELKVEVSEVSSEFDIEEKDENRDITSGHLSFEVEDLSEPFEIDEDALLNIKASLAERRERMAANVLASRENLVAKDIVLQENPKLKTEVAEVFDLEDIVLDENPDLKVNVSSIYEDDLVLPESIDPRDIVLDENPKLKLEVAEIREEDLIIPESISPDDIVLDENPELKVEVAEVYNEEDIVLEDNPSLKTEVEDVNLEEE